MPTSTTRPRRQPGNGRRQHRETRSFNPGMRGTSTAKTISYIMLILCKNSNLVVAVIIVGTVLKIISYLNQ